MTSDIEAGAAARAQDNTTLISAVATSGVDETSSSWSIDVINDTEHCRWIASLGTDAIGELTYCFVGGRIVLIST